MYIRHGGILWWIERLNLPTMQARAYPQGMNAAGGAFILVFNESADVVEVIR